MKENFSFRKAVLDDLDFLVRIDLENDGYAELAVECTEKRIQAHRAKIASFVTDPEKGAWIVEDIGSPQRSIGLIMYSIANREEAAVEHQVGTIYTHTEETNAHVIELNLKLGYRKVRRGPIWDDVVRVGLLKQL